jgi:spore maturation protein B
MTDLLIPGLLTTVCTFALWKKESAYDLLVEGAAEGLVLLKSIIPTLVILMTGISMLRASGAFDTLGHILAPVFSFFGIPTETAVLVLIRPISGSAALAVGAELMGQYGVDSEIGRTVAVMLGSTETTFYTVSVYFAAAGIKKTRYAIPAALIADFVGFFTASWTTRLLF